MNDYIYNLNIAKDNKTYNYSTNCKEPHGLSFDITYDMTAANVRGNISLKAIDLSVFNNLVMVHNVKTYFPISLSVGYQNNYGCIFNGLCVESKKNVNSRFTLDFTLIGADINTPYVKITAKKGTRRYNIKKIFAEALNLRLNSNLLSDNNIIDKNYYYCGNNGVAELRRFFYDENVTIYNNSLFFTKKLQYKQDNIINNVEAYLLEDKMIEQDFITIGLMEYEAVFPLMPQLQPGHHVLIKQSDPINSCYNGTYLIQSVNHSGTIDYRTMCSGTTRCILKNDNTSLLYRS
jgi:hypothetical protein